MIGTADQAAIAEALAAAERDRVPLAPLTETWPGLDVTAAYAVQRLGVQRRTAAGAAVVGHKVGLTSAAMQQLLGVGEPDFGHLIDDMVHGHGTTLDTADLLAPRVEPEVAFVLAEPLTGPGVTVPDVLAATRTVVASIEVIDSRIADWRITLPDTVADNASSAAVVLGTVHRAPSEVDLSGLPVRLDRNGAEVGRGDTSAVLGHPAEAVAWLANTLARLGAPGLAAGHLVLPGACTAAVPVGPDDRVRADFGPLGTVEVSFR